MGAKARRRIKHLPAKLLAVRETLDLSQSEIARLVSDNDKFLRSNISNYEQGYREPSLLVILGYARVAGISTDVLIDDSLDLPPRFNLKLRQP